MTLLSVVLFFYPSPLPRWRAGAPTIGGFQVVVRGASLTLEPLVLVSNVPCEVVEGTQSHSSVRFAAHCELTTRTVPVNSPPPSPLQPPPPSHPYLPPPTYPHAHNDATQPTNPPPP
jgi:hypothetical protein